MNISDMISQQKETTTKAFFFSCGEEQQQQTKGHYENEIKIHLARMYNAEKL